MSGEVAVCSEQRARELVDSIRAHVALAKDALIEAYRSRVWVPLGYGSWETMCDAEFGVRVQLPRQERRDLVAELRDASLSTRAIGSALGVDDRTVRRDLSTAANAAVEPPPTTPVIGVNGKRYEPTRPPRTITVEPSPELAAFQRGSDAAYRWHDARSRMAGAVLALTAAMDTDATVDVARAHWARTDPALASDYMDLLTETLDDLIARATAVRAHLATSAPRLRAVR